MGKPIDIGEVSEPLESRGGGKKLGLADGGETGENLTFAEQMERKAERAEARAEKYGQRADTAAEKAAALQKPINDMQGDTAFFTQPDISSSRGHAFTRRREKMFAAWEKGYEEFKNLSIMLRGQKRQGRLQGRQNRRIKVSSAEE